MTEEQIVAALQRVHELTQQNAPEAAGAAWYALIEEIVGITRRNSRPFTTHIVAAALKASDLPIKELLP